MNMTKEEMESLKVERELRIKRAQNEENALRRRHISFPNKISFWGRYETEIAVFRRIICDARKAVASDNRIAFKTALKEIREAMAFFDERRREDSEELSERLRCKEIEECGTTTNRIA